MHRIDRPAPPRPKYPRKSSALPVDVLIVANRPIFPAALPDPDDRTQRIVGRLYGSDGDMDRRPFWKDDGLFEVKLTFLNNGVGGNGHIMSPGPLPATRRIVASQK